MKGDNNCPWCKGSGVRQRGVVCERGEKDRDYRNMVFVGYYNDVPQYEHPEDIANRQHGVLSYKRSV